MKKARKKNTTTQLLKDFVESAERSINAQLERELKEFGYDGEKFRDGSLKLDRVLSRSESDGRFAIESFSVNGRAVMAVKWTPNGFNIEVNAPAAINAINKNPQFGVKKGLELSPSLIAKGNAETVELEARGAIHERI
jgi:hypothetical protein